MIIPKLLPEQEEDAAILAKRDGAADFSEAGAVKTLTALRAVELRGGFSSSLPLLVVASPIALRMWGTVTRAYFKQEGKIIRSGSDFWGSEAFIVTSYDLLSRNDALSKRLLKEHYAAVIFDEAHALRTVDSKRTTVCYGKRAKVGGLARQADFALALTGTPIVRHADNLYPHLRALGADVLEANGVLSEDLFLQRYTYRQMKAFHPRQRPKLTVIDSRNKEELSKLVFDSGFAVRRYANDLQDGLPPFQDYDIDVPYMMTPELQAASDAVEFPELYEAQTTSTATVRRLLGVAKVEGSLPIIQHLREKYASPMIVFYWHKEVGAALLHHLRQHGKTALIDGSTPAATKGKIEDDWNNGLLDYVVGNIASMGESLNMQRGGNVVAFVEHDWSQARHEQAFKRVFRFGQTRGVKVFYLYADHAADDAAASVAERKDLNAVAILDRSRA